MGVLGAWFMGILEGSGMQDSEGHLILEHKGRYETMYFYRILKTNVICWQAVDVIMFYISLSSENPFHDILNKYLLILQVSLSQNLYLTKIVK